MKKLVELTKKQISKINAGMFIDGQLSYYVKFSKNYKKGNKNGVLIKDPNMLTQVFIVDDESYEHYENNAGAITSREFTELFGDYENIPSELYSKDDLDKLVKRAIK